jgi:uncharacterized protein (PEP-CTERM system associated)
VDQTDQNIFSASPYLVFHPSAATTVRTGYVYTNNWYDDPTAESRYRHSGFFDVSYEMSPKVILNSGYRLDREVSTDYEFYRHEVFIGSRYEYADRSFISAQGGATRTDYDQDDTTTSPFWNVGITHSFDTVTASVASSVKYLDDPLEGSIREYMYGSLTIQKSLPKGSVAVNSFYAEQYNLNDNVWTSERLVAGFNATFELIEHLTGRLGGSFENYRYVVERGTTRRYYADSSLIYSFGNSLSLALTYGYTKFDSAEIATDNMTSNRVILSISKVFNQ